MLEIKNLHVKLEEEEKQILKGVDLTVEAGKVHAIMGPNGSGKSTLSYVLSGRDGYEVTEGSATLDGADLLEMEPEERAAAGGLDLADLAVEGPGEGAPLVAEELALHEALGQGRAVDLDEGALAAGRVVVQGPGDEALARARLAAD